MPTTPMYGAEMLLYPNISYAFPEDAGYPNDSYDQRVNSAGNDRSHDSSEQYQYQAKYLLQSTPSTPQSPAAWSSTMHQTHAYPMPPTLSSSALQSPLASDTIPSTQERTPSPSAVSDTTASNNGRNDSSGQQRKRSHVHVERKYRQKLNAKLEDLRQAVMDASSVFRDTPGAASLPVVRSSALASSKKGEIISTATQFIEETRRAQLALVQHVQLLQARVAHLERAAAIASRQQPRQQSRVA